MGYVKCCVPGCEDKTSSGHRFPNPKKDMGRLKLWLDALQNKSLFEMNPIQLYADRRVCQRHFDTVNYSAGSKRVHLNAVPTLYLPEPIADEVAANQATAVLNLPVTIEVHQTLESVSVQGICNLNLPEDQVSLSQGICGEATSPNQQRISANPVQTPRRILNSIGINTKKELSPKKQLLYGHLKSAHAKLQRTAKAKNSFKRRLRAAEKLSNDLKVENLASLNPTAATFIRCQFRESAKSSKQHRYTQEEKIFALALYKQSPRSYRFLSKIFTLPSKATLDKLLNAIQFDAGIMPHVFRALEAMTRNMDPADRYVSVIFDEMATTPSLHFNEQKGYIYGFEDMGGNDNRSSELADHVLVFILRGIKKNFKQPLAFAFSSRGGAKYHQIKELLVSILKMLCDIGLKPITTICDQSATNCKVIKSLLEDTKQKYVRRDEEYRGGFFEVDHFKIFPIYDPPHLLKGIRNNFLNKCIQFGQNGTKQVAKWSHVIALYEHDNGPNVNEGLRALPHLTDEHIYEHKIKKMKVKCATQIFSQRVASSLRLASSLAPQSALGDAAATASLLYFFDRLFDSMNGSRKNPSQGKILRCGISARSDHLRFWQEDALPMLSSLEYIKVSPKDHKVPPSLCNWIFTVRNFISIWHVLQAEGIEYMLGRHLNQDPIENFFGQIRSHGVRFTKPTCAAFIGAFKALLINNLFKFHKPTFNCEDDKCTSLLDELQFLFSATNGQGGDSSQFLAMPLLQFSNQESALPRIIDAELALKLGRLSNNYVAGFILRKIKKIVASCDECKCNMFSMKVVEANQLIVAREYGGGWNRRLCYPPVDFADAFSRVHSVITTKLKEVSSSKRLGDIIREAIVQNVDFSFLKCEQHNIEVVNYTVKLSMRTLIHAWCKDVNKKLCGKDARPYYGSDIVKQNAIIKHNKTKKK